MQDQSYLESLEKLEVYQTLWERLEQHVLNYPSKEAIVMYREKEEPIRMNFTGYRKAADDYAKCLLKAFPWLQRGDRIGVVGSNRIEVVLCSLMSARIGLSTVLPPCGIQSSDTIAEALKISNCKVLFYEHQFIENQDLKNIMSKTLSLKGVVVFGEGIDIPQEVSVWSKVFQLEGHGVVTDFDLPAPCGPDEDFVILFTSGSTGKPKALVHTSRSLAIFGLFTGQTSGLTDARKMLIDRPLTYGGGFLALWLFLSFHGLTLIVLDTRKSVEQADLPYIFDVIQKENIDTMMVAGYMMHDMVTTEDFPLSKLASLKIGITGGQVMSLDLLRKMQNRLPHLRIHNGYGTSEGGIIAAGDLHITGEYLQVLDALELKVVDPKRNIVPRGEPGEIHIRTPGMSKGYLTEDGFSDLLDKDGWYHTGDSAIMKVGSSREIKVLGRSSDVIKRSTVFVYPQTIEVVLRKHPKVADAHVIGIPDARLYEDLCAVIIPSISDLSEDELRVWGKEQFSVDATGLSLAPAYYRFLESMEKVPRLPNGKVHKLALKEFVLKDWRN